MSSSFTFNNLNALKINRKLNQQTDALSSSFQKLSSGLRITRPSDDAAGLAIAEKLKADTTVYGQALRNANDAISSLNLVDGALSELSSILGRLNEISGQAANGVYNLTQRKALDAEGVQLVNEYNRIVNSTEFNNQSLLAANQSGTRVQLGYGVNGSFAYILGDELDSAAGSGTFQAAITSGTAVASPLGPVDLNGDGKDDLVGIGNLTTEFIYSLSNGDGTFSGNSINVGNTINEVTYGDFDNNGTIDIAASYTSTAGTKIYSNDGSGNFTLVQTMSQGGNNMQAADINGDGILDLVTTATTNVNVKYGNGDGTFQSQQTVIAHGSTLSSVGIGDFNGDGKTDIAVSDTSGSNVVTAYRNNGNSSFSSLGTMSVAGASYNLKVADMNLDGYDDILAYGSSTAIYQSISNADGTSSSGMVSTGITTVGGPLVVVIKDYNSDGIPDIVSKPANTAVITYTGSGTGTYSSNGTTTIVNGNLAVGDFNGDGAQDVFVGKGGGSPAYNTHLANTTNVTTIGRLYLLDQEGARLALTKVESIQDRVAKEQGKVGANLSRLSVGVANLDSLRTNVAEAGSRITDLNVAEEVANMVRLSVLQDSSQALAAQANQNAQTVLQLLRF